MKAVSVLSNEELALTEKATTLTAQLHGISCPSCKSKKNVKNGKINGNQRYRCSKCGVNFRDTTGKTIHHLHLKSKLQAYIECMNQGLSLRKTAKKVDISLRTAFRWRHRFLSAMRKQTPLQHFENSTVSTITLPYTTKAKRIHDRQVKITSIIQQNITGQLSMKVIGSFGSSVTQLASTIQNKEIVKSRSLPKMFKAEEPGRHTLEYSEKLNEIHKHIYNWLNAFRGVASKYLKNYWIWFEHIWEAQNKKSQQNQYMYKCF